MTFKVTLEIENAMVRMRRNGMKLDDIALCLGCSADTVRRHTRHIKVNHYSGGRGNMARYEVEEISQSCIHGHQWTAVRWFGKVQRKDTLGPCECYMHPRPGT